MRFFLLIGERSSYDPPPTLWLMPSLGAATAHHQVTTLGPTIIAVGYNPISRKFLKKQHDSAGGTKEVTWKIYESAK